ncbi:MAG: hypothetical protein L6R41_001199 [Letrouitia leprolyta]|nr:MAG: hypothetical protein L6R41_001199 [Letrouitia leprolyta]
MSELQNSPLNQSFDFVSMDLPGFSNFDEQLSAFDDHSFMVDDTMSTMLATDLEASINHMDEDFLANIDPALLPTCDASLDTFPPIPSLEVTEASMFDPSPGVEWQPMENIESSIDPTLLSPFDMQLDPFAIQTRPFNSGVIFPPNLIESCTSDADFSFDVPPVFRNPFEDSNLDRRAKKHKSPTLRHPSTRSTSAWTRTYQPRVDGSGCPCDLCKGGPVNFASLYGKVDKASKNDRVKKVTKKTTTGKNRRVTKSKSSRVVLQCDNEDSDSSSLSSIPDLDDSEGEPEYKPRPTAWTRRTAAAAATLKRSKRLGKVGAMKNLPKELGIDMEKWW